MECKRFLGVVILCRVDPRFISHGIIVWALCNHYNALGEWRADCQLIVDRWSEVWRIRQATTPQNKKNCQQHSARHKHWVDWVVRRWCLCSNIGPWSDTGTWTFCTFQYSNSFLVFLTKSFAWGFNLHTVSVKCCFEYCTIISCAAIMWGWLVLWS